MLIYVSPDLCFLRKYFDTIDVASRGMSTTRSDGEVIKSITLLQTMWTLIGPH